MSHVFIYVNLKKKGKKKIAFLECYAVALHFLQITIVIIHFISIMYSKIDILQY